MLPHVKQYQVSQVHHTISTSRYHLVTFLITEYAAWPTYTPNTYRQAQQMTYSRRKQTNDSIESESSSCSITQHTWNKDNPILKQEALDTCKACFLQNMMAVARKGGRQKHKETYSSGLGVEVLFHVHLVFEVCLSVLEVLWENGLGSLDQVNYDSSSCKIH